MNEYYDSLERLSKLKRKLTEKAGKVHLITEETDVDVSYAFYLKYPKGMAKKFYKKRPSHTFDVEFKQGFYQASFFYKVNGKASSFKENFFISRDKEVIGYTHDVLGEGSGFRVDFYNVGSAKTFIVFNGAGTSLKSKPFGLDFLLEKGFNVIACFHDDNQYQSLSFEDFEFFVSSAVKGQEVFLYGSSLGGYAALYYSGAVNGTVISAAPRNSVHPDLKNLKSDTLSNAARLPYKHKLFSDIPLTSKKVHIFYDPKVKIDSIFIEKSISHAYPDACYYALEYAGHPVLFHLSRTKQLSSVLESVVNGSFVKIDHDAESVYTDIGRAKELIRKGLPCSNYVNKAFSRGRLPLSLIEALNKLKEKSDALVRKAKKGREYE